MEVDQSSKWFGSVLKQAGLCVMFIWKNQFGSQDEIVYVIIQV